MNVREFYAHLIDKLIPPLQVQTSTKPEAIGICCKLSTIEMCFPKILIIRSKSPIHLVANQFFCLPYENALGHPP